MSRITYEAQSGVAWVNGQRVPKNRRVQLTDAEARFDLALGRIAPVAKGRAKAKPAVEADGE